LAAAPAGPAVPLASWSAATGGKNGSMAVATRESMKAGSSSSATAGEALISHLVRGRVRVRVRVGVGVGVRGRGRGRVSVDRAQPDAQVGVDEEVVPKEMEGAVVVAWDVDM
jgi:hypothetical protein